MINAQIKSKIIILRKKGKTFSEINSILGLKLAKSTISYICRNIVLPDWYNDKVQVISSLNLKRARETAFILQKNMKAQKVSNIDEKVHHLIPFLGNNNVAKIVLSVLYAAEGSKGDRGALMFGNSDPYLVKLFLTMLRQTFNIEERKFRCTVQGRADMDFSYLENFWSKVTQIPKNNFYKPQIDKRTIGKVSKKQGYKGVCRIDYFSSAIDLELKRIINSINQNYLGPMV